MGDIEERQLILWESVNVDECMRKKDAKKKKSMERQVEMTNIQYVQCTLKYIQHTVCTMHPQIYPTYSMYNTPSNIYNIQYVQCTLKYIQHTVCTMYLQKTYPTYSICNAPSNK